MQGGYTLIATALFLIIILLILSNNSGFSTSYPSGIIFERRAKYHLHQAEPGSGSLAYEWFAKAMEAFDQAMDGCAPDNQDAVLRWNFCTRIINSRPDVRPDNGSTSETFLDAFD